MTLNIKKSGFILLSCVSLFSACQRALQSSAPTEQTNKDFEIAKAQALNGMPLSPESQSLSFNAVDKNTRAKLGMNLKAGSGSVINPASALPALIGNGYDSKAQILKSSCLAGDLIPQGALIPSVAKARTDMSFEDLSNALHGSVTGDIGYSSFSAHADVQYAHEAGSTLNSSSFTYYNTITRTFKVENPKLSVLGETLVNPDFSVRAEVEQDCGDEFISTVKAGAILSFTAKFSFRGASNKTAFDGKMAGKIQDLGDLAGNISLLDQDTRKNLNLSIYAYQLGGDYTKLLSVIPNEVVSCSGDTADGLDDCIKVLNHLVSYTADFSAQISGDSTSYDENSQIGLAAINWNTQKYSDVGISYKDGSVMLIPSSPSPILAQEIINTRQDLQNLFTKETMSTQRAKELNLFPILSGERAQISDILSGSENNQTRIAGVANTCFNYYDQVVHIDPTKVADTCSIDDIKTGQCINRCLFERSQLTKQLKIYDTVILSEYADPQNIAFDLTGVWFTETGKMLQLNQIGSFVYILRNVTTASSYTSYNGNGGYINPSIQAQKADTALIRLEVNQPNPDGATFCTYHIDTQLKAIDAKNFELRSIILDDQGAKNCKVTPTPSCAAGQDRFSCTDLDKYSRMDINKTK